MSDVAGEYLRNLLNRESTQILNNAPSFQTGTRTAAK